MLRSPAEMAKKSRKRQNITKTTALQRMGVAPSFAELDDCLKRGVAGDSTFSVEISCTICSAEGAEIAGGSVVAVAGSEVK